MTELITEGEDFVQYLRDLLGSTSWEVFECNRRGELSFGGLVFKLRVGKHMNRPMRAIIALGQFVRMEKFGDAHELGGAGLKKLTPEAPDTCLYYIGLKNSDHLGAMNWHPDGWTRVPDKYSEPEKDSIILDHAALYNKLGRRRP